MKRKIFSTLLALVLLTGLCLVTAVPAGAADPENGVEVETWGEGVGHWTPRVAGCIDNYCIHLTGPMIVKIPYGETLQTFADVDTTEVDTHTVWDIKWTIYDTGTLQLHAKVYLDTTLDGAADTVLTGGFGAVEGGGRAVGAWHDAYMKVGTAWQVEGYDGVDYTADPTVGGMPYTTSSSSGPTLNTLLTDATAGPTWAAAEVVHLAYGYAVETEAYVDDIVIEGTVIYAVEPPLPPLDEPYYRVGDEATVTIYDGVLNVDPMAIDVILITDTPVLKVVSTTDTTGDLLELTETGGDTGVFTGTFTLLGAAPADRELDEIVVSEGDTITLTYSEISVTASVDDTAPEITVVSPLDDATTDDATPVISASYSDTPAGIDEASVEMLVDGEEVDAVADGDDVTYTPSEDLVEGSHDVVVNVSDNAGNEATESWSFRIASWLVEPVVSDGEQTSLDALLTVGVAVSITGDTGDITVGRYASNPQPEAPPTFDMIDDGFFDVKVLAAESATQIIIKFADPAITAESTAHVWDDLEGAWLECSDQGYNSIDEYLWIKVRTDTTPNIAELEGTPFAIGGEPAVEEISAYYKGYSGDAEVVETTDLLKAANDWADAVVPPDFTEPISTTQLLALANEWAATP